MTAKILQFRDYQGLAESRLPPEEVGSVVAWPIVPVDPTMLTVADLPGFNTTPAAYPFIAPDGDSA